MTWREFFAHLFLLVVVLAVLYPSVFLRGDVISSRALLFRDEPWKSYAPAGLDIPKNSTTMEMMFVFSPQYVAVRKAISQGEWPLWYPYLLCGMPLLANYQSAVFYPIRLLMALPDYYFGLTLFMLSRFLLCGVTAYLAGRMMGFRKGTARFLSLAWMLSGFNMHWAYWPVIDSSAWVPLLFVGCDRAVSGRYRQAFFLTLSSGLLSLICGHPETGFLFVAALGLYFVVRVFVEKRSFTEFRKALLVLGAAWCIAFLAASVQVIPFLEYLANSHTVDLRANVEKAQQLRPALEAPAFISFWVPRFLGATVDGNLWCLVRQNPLDPGQQEPFNSNFISIIYPGMAVWVGLSLLADKRIRLGRWRSRIIALSIPTVLGLLLAFNLDSTKFIHNLPVFSAIWRTHYVFFAMFSLPLMACLSLEEWFDSPARLKRLLWVMPLFACIISVSALLFLIYKPAIESANVGNYIAIQLGLAILFMALSVAVLALHTRIRHPAFLMGMLTAILVIDLLVAGRGLRPTTPKAATDIQPELMKYLASLEQPSRFSLSSAGIPQGAPQEYGIEELNGYDGITPRRINRFLQACVAKAWETIEPVVALQYYVVREGAFGDNPSQFEMVKRVDGYQVFRNRRALPRARLAGTLEVLADGDAVLKRICEPGFDPMTTAVTEVPLGEPLPRAVSAHLGEAKITEKTFTRCRVDVNAEERCVLVLADTYFPGWKAWIDDEPTDLFPAYYAFRGVITPEGRHTILFEYDPLSFRIGMTISVAVLLAGSAGAVFIILQRRNRARR